MTTSIMAPRLVRYHGRKTTLTLSTFGIVAALAGIEHGIGEIMQGNRASGGLLIESWPDSQAFRILAGEPALTVIPNLLVTGILAVLVSVIFLVCSTVYVQRKQASLVLLLLSVVLLLVGGGFGPPLLGIILGTAATLVHVPLRWWRAHLPAGVLRLLAHLWLWCYGAGIIAWLLLMPGTILIDLFWGVPDPDRLIPILIFTALGLLLLAIGTALAYDTENHTDMQALT